MAISKKGKEIIFRVFLFLVFLTLVFWFSGYVSEKESVQNLVAEFGYWGIFTASVISGFNLIVPIPISTFIPVFLQSGFEFWPLVFIISIGMTSGDSISYFLGILGRRLVQSDSIENHWIFKKLTQINQQHVFLPYVFLLMMVSFVPVPNEITVLPMAFLGYKFYIMFPIIFAGNIVFNYLSGTGVIVLFNLVG